jgi:tryptophan synthase alpha subunit
MPQGSHPLHPVGDPSLEMTVPLMRALVESGADIIELGVPFSDPMADGPTIQRSSERALKRHTNLPAVLEAVTRFRAVDDATPVVLMGYANPIEAMGYERFAQDAAKAGVDGVLVVDYPPEEGSELLAQLKQRGIDGIYLLAPTSETYGGSRASRRLYLLRIAQRRYRLCYAGFAGDRSQNPWDRSTSSCRSVRFRHSRWRNRAP